MLNNIKARKGPTHSLDVHLGPAEVAHYLAPVHGKTLVYTRGGAVGNLAAC